MYNRHTFHSTVAVNLKDCSKIEDSLYTEIKRVEGACVSVGFVKPDSVKLLSRSIGKTQALNSGGDIYYDVVFEADVFNPIVGDTLKCVVNKVNKLGVMAYGVDNIPACVLIARQHHSGTFQTCQENDEIECEIIGSRFNIKDTEIQVLGKFI